jgi:flavin reductase (DIM6/NTAB) family NADH-FMN oxidoreductase RutF
MKRIITPGEIATKDLHQYIIGGVSPRPIAFVSTLNESGIQNVAPYSFFNAFSSNPPILVFSSNRRVSDNTTKDTLHNVKMTKECVVNVVNYNIWHQMSLASVEFPSDVSEFQKVGLTPEDSLTVKAPRVLESPMNLECAIQNIIELGNQGGAGHLIICEVKKIAISESVLDGDRINPHKLDLMGRMGRNYYVRASGEAVLELHQGVTDMPIGWDGLPSHIRTSKVLSGNEICKLAALTSLPIINDEETRIWKVKYAQIQSENREEVAAKLIRDGEMAEAWWLLNE